MEKIKIREYKDSDKEEVIKMIEELQDFEKSVEEYRISGREAAAKYFPWLIKTCEEESGKIFILEFEGKIAGFSAVYLQEDDDFISPIKKWAYLSDLLIKDSFRGKGLSKYLFEAVKEHAKKLGVKYLQVTTLANNQLMREVNLKQGFREYEVNYIQEL